jgi:hypothetical protein
MSSKRLNISLKIPTLIYLIILSLISPTRFGALPHQYQGLHISFCEEKYVVVVTVGESVEDTNTVNEIRTDEVQR